MTRRLSILLAGPSLLGLATAAAAQTSPQPVGQSPDPATVAQEVNEEVEETAADGAIIITARRRAESLMDVPQTVSAVTGQDLQEFNIQRFEDISSLVSGLTLESESNGFSARAQVRGVQFEVNSQGTPTMEMYINEVPIEPNNMFQSQFDVGQIEVLKGPQGTLRGRSAPSGAMTLTTRRPDLNETGGSVSFVGDSHGGINMQAGVGLPIIQDVLAIRVAGLLDQDDAGGVKSATGGANPRGRTQAIRATLRFEPTDNFSAIIMGQRLVRTLRDYGGIQFGPGTVGLTAVPGFVCPGTNVAPVNFICPATATRPAVFAPPGFNGPPLDPDDEMNVQDFLGYTRQGSSLFTAQLDWTVAGQRLSYVGSYQRFTILSEGDDDGSNTVVGIQRDLTRGSHSVEKRKTHELRLSSDERVPIVENVSLDYTVGGYYGRYYGLSASERVNTVLQPGAFGSPLGTASPGGPGLLSPFTYQRGYVTGFDNLTPRDNREKAVFGSAMLHLFENTELSLGGRNIWVEQTKEVSPVGVNGKRAVANPNATFANPNAPCPATIGGAPVLGSTYPGTCDVLVVQNPTQFVRPIPERTTKFNTFVWNASLSHHVTPDLMVYASYGTAWRPGPGPITQAPICAADATPAANLPAGQDPNQCFKFNFLDPDKSKSIELGFKAAFLDRRLNVSVAVYRQKFSGLFISGGTAITLTGNCAVLPTENQQGLCSVGQSNFTYGAPAKTKGIDIETSFRPSRDFNMGANFSWARGRFTSGLIPCRDTDLDGVRDAGPTPTNPAQWVARGGPYGPTLCDGAGEPASLAPPWNASVRGEYSREVFAGGRAFIRALFNYYPKNKHRPDAVSVDSTPATQRPPNAYGILNLFAGLRSDEGAWEVSVSARNVLNNKTVLTRGLNEGTLIAPQSGMRFAPTANQNSGYRTISFVQRREFQVSARFAFGSR